MQERGGDAKGQLKSISTSTSTMLDPRGDFDDIQQTRMATASQSEWRPSLTRG